MTISNRKSEETVFWIFARKVLNKFDAEDELNVHTNDGNARFALFQSIN